MNATIARLALQALLGRRRFWLLLAFGPAPGAGILGMAMWLAFVVSLPVDRTPVVSETS